MTADVRARSPQSPQIRGQRASEDELVSLELILARNLVSTLHLAAVLLDETQTIVFYNPPAAALMGTNFEDTGPIPVESWRDTYGPLGPGGERRSGSTPATAATARSRGSISSSACQ